MIFFMVLIVFLMSAAVFWVARRDWLSGVSVLRYPTATVKLKDSPRWFWIFVWTKIFFAVVLLTAGLYALYRGLKTQERIMRDPIVVTMQADGPGGWLPAADQIKELEHELSVEFAKAQQSLSKQQGALNPLETYGRRYMGVGEKLIDVFGFCANSPLTEKDIRDGMHMDDGGSCYFAGTYDSVARKFTHFYFNGVA